MKKKVLFVINTMGRAGAERCLLHLMKEWEKEGDEYEISLFSVLGRGELFEEVPEGVRVLNRAPQTLSVFDKGIQKDVGRRVLQAVRTKGYMRKELFSLLRLLAWQVSNRKVSGKKLCWKILSDTAETSEEKYDLAVGYLQGSATYYVLDHVKAAKKIVFLHNDYEASGYCPWWDKPYYEKADRIYCVSNFIAERMKEIFPSCADKTEVFYNFTDEQWVKERAAEGRADDMKRMQGEPCLLTAARLEPMKAFDIAIETMALLKQKGVRAAWYVLGEGTERSRLEKKIEACGVQDCFFLLGQKENPYPYIAACDIYVQETRYEGFCTSITEAVILGKKVVASDCSGNKEQLEYYGTGVLTKLSPQAAAEGIIKAWKTQADRVDFHCLQKNELERLKRDA